ncbi:pyruvate ferredoxin oxidoreductase [Vulcanisaeta distributa]|uniref:2-oxoacid oxidoreductase (ferredoxin) n=1 Tax=Vulcanisaeta distributa (strain DSM 14429 / JCM 11212 / NBRC 100878 / IC-017) TaxID=572478 RepID=E1QNZ4_VULDI|nr:pyruvate ferredoxin oxidoreductase [Vulcanisaeta distributa]ADN51359.1 pyruvate flavodoxin/ferredoxin oxidoreductase domain protein [Vulcanisaeta distributa DSM 14429]
MSRQISLAKQVRKVLVGDHAVAEAVKLARVNVISAYPITPQTLIVERISEMIERGELRADYVRVESEFAALATVYGAAAGGARAFTATSSHGLFYMYEMLWWAAASRVPLVMAVVTRVVGPPWNIHDEHTDLLAIRDSGWIIGMAQNVQEAFDMTLTAFRISEDERVLLPVAVGLDGFILSHTAEPLDIPSQEDVDAWLPPRNPRIPYVIEPGGETITMGNLPRNDVYHALLKKYMDESMESAKKVIADVYDEYGKLTGRKYGPLTECYRCSDAKYLAVSMGAWSGDIMTAVDRLRDEGYPIGLLRIRYIRPFPEEDITGWINGMKGVIVFDRDYSAGMGGILASEVSGFVPSNVSFEGILAGVGGFDVSPDEFKTLMMEFINKVEHEGLVRVRKYWYIPKIER